MKILKNMVIEDKIMLNLKVTAAEKEALKRMADLYAKGNLSMWLRYAGLNYKPTTSELVNK